ncbi:MAG: hypothetical protein IKZ19_06630 [Clostridia bacterium]|nr:hypothetical protein [Clostridia bacterium]
MKRIFALIVPFVLVFALSGCVLEEMSVLYSQRGEQDGLVFAVNKTADCCFVGGYTCEEYSENMEITVPDEYNGVPVTRLGGYFGRGVPTPFAIDISASYIDDSKNGRLGVIVMDDSQNFCPGEGDTLVELVFTLNIGKNLEVIEFVEMGEYYPHDNEDGSVTYYHPVVNVVCDEENEYFYSRDGKLYDKDTDMLVTGFSYSKN